MDRNELNGAGLTAILDELQQGRITTGKAQANNSAAIALCELVQPTLEKKSQGENYFRLSASELRSKLDDRDLIIYQAAQIIMLLSDKAMDLDSWLGTVNDVLKNSVAYLTGKKGEAGSHEQSV
ncbi:hypothetical protein [Levilactobacillus koreensis]|uniref:Uncharacterized protein n=1 Tax=Levilactobacillus koreensis TaxID=637971 RepID=A0AAC9ER29_9LACO|nr:hypothetical protein [Levilactobacillus koreensis]AKP63736.1 hypothetical protein ABN16_01145 [Levilactobacillus koreensis]